RRTARGITPVIGHHRILHVTIGAAEVAVVGAVLRPEPTAEVYIGAAEHGVERAGVVPQRTAREGRDDLLLHLSVGHDLAGGWPGRGRPELSVGHTVLHGRAAAVEVGGAVVKVRRAGPRRSEVTEEEAHERAVLRARACRARRRAADLDPARGPIHRSDVRGVKDGPAVIGEPWTPLPLQPCPAAGT